jgi:hypothetical protein
MFGYRGVPSECRGLRWMLRDSVLVVLRLDADDRMRAATGVDFECRVEGALVAEEGQVAAPWRVLEAYAHRSAGRIRPPRVDCTLRCIAVGGDVTEQVEAQRHRREEVGKEPILAEHLEWLWCREPRAHGPERARCDEVRAGRAREAELEPAAHRGRARPTSRRAGPQSGNPVLHASAPGQSGRSASTRSLPRRGGRDRRRTSSGRPGRHCRRGHARPRICSSVVSIGVQCPHGRNAMLETRMRTIAADISSER